MIDKKEQSNIAKMTSHWLRTMTKLLLMILRLGIVTTEERQYIQLKNWSISANITTGLRANWFSWLQLSITNCIILASISQQSIARRCLKRSKAGNSQQRPARRCLKRVKASTAQQRPARRSLKQREANIYHQSIARSSLKRIKACIAQRRPARRLVKHAKASTGTTTVTQAF